METDLQRPEWLEANCDASQSPHRAVEVNKKEKFPLEMQSDFASESKDKLEDILALYLKDSFLEHGNIIGFFDDSETFATITEKMREKGFSYSVRDSDIRKKNVGTNLSVDGCTVFFQLKAMSIKFFGLPFVVDKTTHYQCVYGRKYYKSRTSSAKIESNDLTSLPMKKRRNVVSKKMGCLAKMTLKKIIVYPDYELKIDSDWRMKKKTIECLRKDLSDANKQVANKFRYYLSVSVQSSHNHPPMQPSDSPNEKARKLLKNPYRKMRVEDEDIADECWTGFPSGSAGEEEPPAVSSFETKVIHLDEANFLTSFVKPEPFESSGGTPTIIQVMNNFNSQEEPTTFQIQAIQYTPSVRDLQVLCKDKLKRIFSLTDACYNPTLLLRMLGDLEQVEVALSSDNFDPNEEFQSKFIQNTSETTVTENPT